MTDVRDRFMLMLPMPGGRDPQGAMAEVTARDVPAACGALRWCVAVAQPRPGSAVAWDMSDTTLHDGDAAVQDAARDFLSRMEATGLSGLIDTAEARIRGDTPLEICNAATEAIHDDIPDVDDPEARVDDFDAHPLSELREALVDACPAYSGEDPDGPA